MLVGILIGKYDKAIPEFLDQFTFYKIFKGFITIDLVKDYLPQLL